jgi:hypothetical protein
LENSVSRAASFTGSPITVYSKRRIEPTLPATASPADTPIPTATSGTSTGSRRASTRPAASAAPAASGWS